MDMKLKAIDLLYLYLVGINQLEIKPNPSESESSPGLEFGVTAVGPFSM